jgi:hypothetical protein
MSEDNMKNKISPDLGVPEAPGCIFADFFVGAPGRATGMTVETTSVMYEAGRTLGITGIAISTAGGTKGMGLISDGTVEGRIGGAWGPGIREPSVGVLPPSEMDMEPADTPGMEGGEMDMAGHGRASIVLGVLKSGVKSPDSPPAWPVLSPVMASNGGISQMRLGPVSLLEPGGLVRLSSCCKVVPESESRFLTWTNQPGSLLA